MEATGCVHRETCSSSSSSFTSPFPPRSPPLPCSPNPLSCRPHCRRSASEGKEREAGVRYVDGKEHADGRALGPAMTTMLSPKIRQTRRGRTSSDVSDQLNKWCCCLNWTVTYSLYYYSNQTSAGASCLHSSASPPPTTLRYLWMQQYISILLQLADGGRRSV